MSITDKITDSQIIKHSKKSRIILADIDGKSEKDGTEKKIIIKELSNDLFSIYQRLSLIESQYFPKIYELEQRKEYLLVAEEYIEGRLLADILSERAFFPQEALILMLQLCNGIACLHHFSPPVIHRDLTPWNLLLTDEHLIKIIDFDAARIYKPNARCDTKRLGTAEYAPPEQFGFSQTDERSDIYSMGVILYELVYCRAFRRTEEHFSHRASHRKINHIITRCTMFPPCQRYQSVEELKRELIRALPLKLRLHYHKEN